MKSWFHDHHHAIETMQSRVHDMSSLWRPSLCYLCYHIFSIFCYISMTTAANADLKKTQNVRKVELHTAYMRKIGTFVWREKPDPHHQPYHSSTHLKCTQMIQKGRCKQQSASINSRKSKIKQYHAPLLLQSLHCL